MAETQSQPKSETPSGEDSSSTTHAKLIRRLIELKRQITSLEDSIEQLVPEKETLEKLIGEQLATEGIDKLVVDGVSVSWKQTTYHSILAARKREAIAIIGRVAPEMLTVNSKTLSSRVGVDEDFSRQLSGMLSSFTKIGVRMSGLNRDK